MAIVEMNGKMYDMWSIEAQELVADIYAVENQHKKAPCEKTKELLEELYKKCELYEIKQ